MINLRNYLDPLPRTKEGGFRFNDYLDLLRSVKDLSNLILNCSFIKSNSKDYLDLIKDYELEEGIDLDLRDRYVGIYSYSFSPTSMFQSAYLNYPVERVITKTGYVDDSSFDIDFHLLIPIIFLY